MIAVNPEQLDVSIDPRPCELCGCTIDQHERIDTPEGPEFFCFPDDDIVTNWELADPRDCWKHTGEAPPQDNVRNGPQTAVERAVYRTAQSTVDAFWYVISLKDPDKLSAWLRDHPRDTARLLKLLEAK